MTLEELRDIRRIFKSKIDKSISELFVNSVQNKELPPIDLIREFALHEVVVVCGDFKGELNELLKEHGTDVVTVLLRRNEPDYRCASCAKILGIPSEDKDEKA